MIPGRRPPTLRLLLRGLSVLSAVTVAASAAAQTPAAPDPRAAQPERPTVATHAYTVAPGYVEIEAGAQRQPTEWANADVSVPVLFKIGLGSRLQLDVAPGFARVASDGGVRSGVTDVMLAVKWRLADRAPVLGAFALQPYFVLPTGSSERGTGAGHPAAGVLAISSHAVGPVALDLNIGYTRTGGDGTTTPTNTGVWCVSSGFPVAGPLGAVAELFGAPGSTGPAGERPSVGFLVGPTLQASPSLVFDAGLILNVTGLGDTVVYAGLTWNVGRAWTHAPSQYRLSPTRTWR